MNIRINNQYLAEDTRNVLPGEIRENQFKDFNFCLIYNLPNISHDRKGNLIIKINEEIHSFKWDSRFIQNLSERIKSTIYVLEKSNLRIQQIKATLHWRMVIGLGASHPQETSMTLHHIYGIPYIPGSSVKGVTRHWVIIKFFDEIGLNDLKQINCLEKILETADLNNPDKNKRDSALDKQTFKEKFKAKDSKGQWISPDDKLYEFLILNQSNIILSQRLFGTLDKKGEVIFFDAFPASEINLKIDIMNPHYPEYYIGEKPPADWQNPTPIKFLTVEKSMFQFFLASRDTNLLSQAEKFLIEALKESGIGAKSSLGYGMFCNA